MPLYDPNVNIGVRLWIRYSLEGVVPRIPVQTALRHLKITKIVL